jgi:uncharacterized membrane protein YeaQ/YmgE (transglycosylase-associated protein family)
MGLVILLILVLVFGWLLLATIGLAFSLLVTIVIAGLIGWAADRVVPGKLPGGWVGAVLAGLIGGFVGRLLFHTLGIHLGLGIIGSELIPAFVGAVLVVIVAEWATVRRGLGTSGSLYRN